MRNYQQLRNQDQNSRRTMADALEILREEAGFDDRHDARIHIGELLLPSGQIVGLVGVFFDHPSEEQGFIVWLPSSANFRGIVQGTSERNDFRIGRLDGATVDAAANVLLSDGTQLRAVEVVPAALPHEPSELDWRIVKHTISIIGAEDRCCRSAREGLPPDLQHMVRDRRLIDCSRLTGLKLPPLKEVARQIARRDKTLRKLSDQKIADALCKFGMRIPKARPRST